MRPRIDTPTTRTRQARKQVATALKILEDEPRLSSELTSIRDDLDRVLVEFDDEVLDVDRSDGAVTDGGRSSVSHLVGGWDAR